MAQIPCNTQSFIQGWQENVSEMVIMNLLKDVLSKICITGHTFMYKMQYSEISMTIKFHSGHAQGFLNLFTAGNVCVILLLRLIRYHGVKRKPNGSFKAIN